METISLFDYSFLTILYSTILLLDYFPYSTIFLFDYSPI